MKKEYLKRINELKKIIKKTNDCDEKRIMLLAIEAYKKTIQSEEITDEDIEKILK